MAELAHALSTAPHDRESLSSAAQQIAGGNGRILFEALLERQQVCGGDQDMVVAFTAALLERMMDARPGVAGYLLARLMRIARQHNVYDGIGLALGSNPTEELADNLMRLASEGFGPRLRTWYEACAADIRERARSRANEGPPPTREHPSPSVRGHTQTADVVSWPDSCADVHRKQPGPSGRPNVTGPPPSRKGRTRRSRRR
jgi:hypothetical protein